MASGKAGALPPLLPLPSNIRLAWKLLTVSNTLAYYNTKLFTTVKSFISQAPDNLTDA
jgi:hypothetical protein